MRRAAAASGLIVALLAAGAARAQVRLCLEVRAPAAVRADLERLVRSEVGHHPTHRLADGDCQAGLEVQLLEIEGARNLTVRIDQQVPVRYPLDEPAELADRLAQALALVLQNEPVHLGQDITHFSAVQRAVHGLLVAGHNLYRFELHQDLVFIAGSDQVLPAAGGAFAVTRGSGHFQIYARVFAGGWPEAAGPERRMLRVMTGAGAGLSWEQDALGSTSLALGAGLSLAYYRFEGPDPDAPGERAAIDVLRPAVDLRLGLRTLRLYDFDLDLWLAASLPWWPADDVDVKLLGPHGAWTPSLRIGLGVGF